MIKNLRKKFIIVAMCSTFVVLTAIMGVVNIANYSKIIQRADRMTELLAENDGSFEKKNNEEFKEPGEDKKEDISDNDRKIREKPEGFSPETPFATRFFTVSLDEDGNVISSDMGKIAAISQEDGEAYAKEVFQKDSEKGFKDVYRYRITEIDDDIMIIFLDCRQDLDNSRAFALTSVAVSVSGLLAVFILVVIFSKVVFRPVEESYEKQKQFITDASHEIKTPLTIIDANTEVLEMESGENQWTKSTRNQIKRLSSLTQQLVTLSKLDEKADRMERSEFSLSDVVADSVEPFDVLARTREKNLSIDINENINFIGNQKEIRQLVGILMDNALKYSSEKGNIRISLKKKGKKIYLEVWNQTEDIPQGNMDILFERFYRMDSSRNSETGGTGIGLSVAKAIAVSHRGRITAYSEDGKSIRIMVEFKMI
ncbi:MAG: sensor histidine kinase [Eubacterium sp.]